jgi:hypothetical protein
MVAPSGFEPESPPSQGDILPLNYEAVMVRREGLEPPKPEGSWFTARCNCRYATDARNSMWWASSELN